MISLAMRTTVPAVSLDHAAPAHKQVIAIAPKSIGKRIITRLFDSLSPEILKPLVSKKVAGRASDIEERLLSLAHNCILPDAIIANDSIT
jgi:hypothetical protein